MASRTGTYLLFFFAILFLLGLRDEQAAREELARVLKLARNVTETLRNETFNANHTKVGLAC